MLLINSMKTITEQKLKKYFTLTETALKKAKLSKNLTKEQEKIAIKFKDFCSNYLKDAKHFKEKGDYVTAFAALNYAHAWLDAGAIQDLFDVKGQNKLFTVD